MDTGIDVVPLLEREAELALLAECAGEARQGAGRLVLIAGEAGVGKSALVEHVERGLPGATWYWGACDGPDRHPRRGRAAGVGRRSWPGGRGKSPGRWASPRWSAAR